ncbi:MULTISPECIES: hypothetical protein [unclassified Streptomyces]|uniref:hypothetical protein n=1 Tax=unclassified Streptomyces TaxID=2593676 RepID=UPI000BAC4E62|nr:MULTISPECIES: hypothetical protein [unclassified Streptomyces]ASY34259.1 hypothetical protein CAC01_17600 [Streptomyces sp. CLI2509]MYX23961.1 hypothetical protein [Streptomyces sp. SID8380]
MRATAAVAALAGSLALGALAAPAAQAATKPPALDLSFGKATVNGGKPVVVSTGSAKTTVKVTFTAKHGKNVDVFDGSVDMVVGLYRGTDVDNAARNLWSGGISCAEPSSTSLSCTTKITVPASKLSNTDASTGWKLFLGGIAWNGQNPDKADDAKISTVEQQKAATATLQRASKLTVNAAPEPVKKNKTITVTGALTRANWDTDKYAGYTKQSVKLQFKKKGTSTYKTLKTVTTDSKGNLRTTTKATADGYFRYSFAGTSTTPAVSAAGDYVDVK